MSTGIQEILELTRQELARKDAKIAKLERVVDLWKRLGGQFDVLQRVETERELIRSIEEAERSN